MGQKSGQNQFIRKPSFKMVMADLRYSQRFTKILSESATNRPTPYLLFPYVDLRKRIVS